MSPQRLRAYVLVAVRDVLTPCTGLGLATYLSVTGLLEHWHLPLIAGLCGVPLAVRGASEKEDPP